MKEIQQRIFIIRYTLLVALLVLLIFKFDLLMTFSKTILGAFSSIISSLLIAYFINIIMVRVEKKLQFFDGIKLHKWKRSISLLASLFLIFIMIWLLISLVVPSVVKSINLVLSELPVIFSKLQTTVENLFQNNDSTKEFIKTIEINWKVFFHDALTFLGEWLSQTFGTLFKFFNLLVGGVFNFILTFIFALYILLDKERFIRAYERLSRLYMNPVRKEKVNISLGVIHQTFSSFIQGQCIEAFILGSLCVLGMFILKFPYPVMIGTLVGFINIIPIVGAYVGGAIGFLLIFTVKPSMAFGFLAFLVLLQQFESNIIYPRVVGNAVGLPGVYVLGAVMFFGTLAGIPGMFFGIPLVASMYKLTVLFINNKEKRLNEKNMRDDIVES